MAVIGMTAYTCLPPGAVALVPNTVDTVMIMHYPIDEELLAQLATPRQRDFQEGPRWWSERDPTSLGRRNRSARQ